MSGKESDGFPNGLEAFFLVVALLGATWLAYGLLSALAPLTGMEPREFPGVAIERNGSGLSLERNGSGLSL